MAAMEFTKQIQGEGAEMGQVEGPKGIDGVIESTKTASKPVQDLERIEV